MAEKAASAASQPLERHSEFTFLMRVCYINISEQGVERLLAVSFAALLAADKKLP